MNFISTRLPYRQTGYFNKIVTDYLDLVPGLKDFFAHTPSLKGIQAAIETRKKFTTNRAILAVQLEQQYAGIPSSASVMKNIERLKEENTFTITTAHQNNIFTGPLYFIYKILHTIKLAEHCKKSLPHYNFVPVYYTGSEDADLEELNHIHLGGAKLVWNTKQKGAVGRMIIDKEFVQLIGLMEGQLSVLPSGNEITKLIKECYKEGDTIQHATFRFVHTLFADYGLLVLLPDNAALKGQMTKLFEDDLLNQTPSGIVELSAGKLSAAGYKVQANPREINLFYLKDNIRERIEKVNGGWQVISRGVKFTKEELLNELMECPERFSPNVILRGLYQETILPNIAFIGGGGNWLTGCS